MYLGQTQLPRHEDGNDYLWAVEKFERSSILTLAQEGREAAMQRGMAFGSPSKLKEDKREALHNFKNGGESIFAIVSTLNLYHLDNQLL